LVEIKHYLIDFLNSQVEYFNHEFKGLILVALLLAAFLVNLDTTLVNVALPALVRDLHATTTQLQWVVDAYNLVFAALLLTFGSLSDRFGRKGMLLAGLAVAMGPIVGGYLLATSAGAASSSRWHRWPPSRSPSWRSSCPRHATRTRHRSTTPAWCCPRP
jgi:MFS family permease